MIGFVPAHKRLRVSFPVHNLAILRAASTRSITGNEFGLPLGIANKYRPSPSYPRPVGRALLRYSRPFTVQNTNQTLYVRQSTQLHLSYRNSVYTILNLQFPSTHVVSARHYRTERSFETLQPVVAHLLERKTRVNSLAIVRTEVQTAAYAGSKSLPTTGRINSAEPRTVDTSLPRVVRRNTPAPGEKLSREAPRASQSEPLLKTPDSTRQYPGALPSAVLAPAEINRVADQVIQMIDRRLSAHRERMGR